MNFEALLVMGIGSVGANTVLNIIRDIPELKIYCNDYDKVEVRNYMVGTQPYMQSHLNKLKTQSLQQLSLMQAKKKIDIFNKKIESEKDILDILDKIKENNILILDAFDDNVYRKLFDNIIKLSDKNINIIHAGFSENFSGSMIWHDVWSVDSKKNKSDFDICTAEGARSFIMALTSLLSMVIVNFYYHGIKRNLYFDKNFKILRY